MTQQQNNDVVFYDKGKEYSRVGGNGPWKPQTPTEELEVTPPNSIIFNTSDTKEIAKFTEEGFYYKGAFIDDAGEVHRLLKEVLKGMLPEQNQ